MSEKEQKTDQPTAQAMEGVSDELKDVIRESLTNETKAVIYLADVTDDAVVAVHGSGRDLSALIVLAMVQNTKFLHLMEDSIKLYKDFTTAKKNEISNSGTDKKD